MSLVGSGFHSQETWIPVQLALYAEKQEIIELLKLFVAFKVSCSGKIKAKSPTVKRIKEALGIKSRTTFRNHLSALKTLNWIGFNEKSGYYFIRSFERICSDLRISARTKVHFHTDYFPDFRAFNFATVIGHRIKALAYAKKLGKEEFRFVPTYWADTNPNLAPISLKYNCLSLPRMQELTGKSKSRCSEIMDQAEKAEFVITKKKLITVDIVPKNKFLRRVLQEAYPNSYNRFRIKMITRGKNAGMVKILEQMPDEIIPLLRYKRY